MRFTIVALLALSVQTLAVALQTPRHTNGKRMMENSKFTPISPRNFEIRQVNGVTRSVPRSGVQMAKRQATPSALPVAPTTSTSTTTGASASTIQGTNGIISITFANNTILYIANAISPGDYSVSLQPMLFSIPSTCPTTSFAIGSSAGDFVPTNNQFSGTNIFTMNCVNNQLFASPLIFLVTPDRRLVATTDITAYNLANPTAQGVLVILTFLQFS